MTASIETIEIASIDRSVQVRVKTDRSVVDDYWRALNEDPPADFPKIICFRDPKTSATYLADGNHRLESRIKNGEKMIEAEIREGGKREALAYALGSSKGHGLRFSNACKRNAVLLALKDAKLKKMTDQQIADLIGVSQPFVWKLRKSTAITVIDSDEEPPPSDHKLAQLVTKFRRIFGEVPEQDRARFQDQILEILGAQ